MFGRNGAKSRPARNARVEAGPRVTPEGSAARPVHLVEDMRQGAQK
jgi:hypothetical protein